MSKSPGEFSPVKVKLHQSVELFWNHIGFFDIVVYMYISYEGRFQTNHFKKKIQISDQLSIQTWRFGATDVQL